MKRLGWFLLLALVCSTSAKAQSIGGSCGNAINAITGYAFGGVSSGAVSSMAFLACNSGVWTLQPVQVGAATASCASGTAGQIQWTGSVFEGCDGSNWDTFNTSTTITLGTSVKFQPRNVKFHRICRKSWCLKGIR
jgi:hypothetical protein